MNQEAKAEESIINPNNTMPRFFIAQERKFDLAGNESHLHYVTEHMEFDRQARQLMEYTTAFTSWGAFNTVLTISIAADDSFHVTNQDSSFKGHGKLYGPQGNWTIMEFHEATVAQTNEGFRGAYLFGKSQVTAQKIFYDIHFEQKKYFTAQRGFHISSEQFTELQTTPKLIPEAFVELQKMAKRGSERL